MKARNDNKHLVGVVEGSHVDILGPQEVTDSRF